MSIEETWGSINSGQDDDLKSMLKASRLSKYPSQNPLGKIRKNLLLNIGWGCLICLFYIAIIIHFPLWQVQLAMFVVLIFSLWALYTAYLQYKQMDPAISASMPVLSEMKRHYESINNWITTQQRVALLIYPISATGGFMLGGVVGSGKSVEVIMSKPMVIVVLLVSIAILVPACYYLARWMCSYSFGKHLKALKENIEALEEEK